MDVFLSILAILFSLIGLAGCIIPGLPGPPLNFISLLLLQFAFKPYDPTFLVIWGIVTVVVVVVDYFLPVWVSKKFGATRSGIIGSIIGMLVGLIFPPIGIIAGLILGAITGDLIAGRSFTAAFKSGIGSALGTLFSTGFKFIISGILTYYTFKEIFIHFT